MLYRYCGHSGIQLPAISLGLWHNFGAVDSYATARDMILSAFGMGICHFDIANNYGPPPGTAEETFGRVMREDLRTHRDELFITSKAGHDMWPGVYGTGSSRKNLIASCDASLRRTGLEYFDVFYSHRYDGVTPVEETMQALVDIVRSGKALYAGISKYPPELQRVAYDYLREAKVPCLVSQYRASIFDRKAINANFAPAADAGSGIVCFSPLAQGLLTSRYLHGIPTGSRAAGQSAFLKTTDITSEKLEAVLKLNEIAASRGQTLAEMAVAWLLADSRVSSVIVGASRTAQIADCARAVDNITFTPEELRAIDDASLSVAVM